MPGLGFYERLRCALLPAGVDVDRLEGIQAALTHTSYAYEASAPCEHNERLEFLGDAVLGLCVADALFQANPHLDPGAMTRLRAGLVSGAELAQIAAAWDLGPALHLGRSEDMSSGRQRQSNLSRALEAVIGAVYLGAGLPTAQLLVQNMLGDRLTHAVANAAIPDPKTRLQELVQARGMAPAYRVVGRSGPAHLPNWRAAVKVGGVCAYGEGASLRQAEKVAARRLLEVLQWQRRGPGDQGPTN